jgi:hypothetical protein
MIRVARAATTTRGEIKVKTRGGRRDVPIAALSREYLVEHRISTDGEALVFGAAPRSGL